MNGPTLFDAAAEVTANEGRYRASDPATSKAAAYVVRAGNTRARVLAALCSASDGLNGWEVSVRCDISRVHAATTRCEELEHLGFATRTGATRPTDTGCEALLFFATPEGERVAADLEKEMGE